MRKVLLMLMLMFILIGLPRRGCGLVACLETNVNVKSGNLARRHIRDWFCVNASFLLSDYYRYQVVSILGTIQAHSWRVRRLYQTTTSCRSVTQRYEQSRRNVRGCINRYNHLVPFVIPIHTSTS